MNLLNNQFKEFVFLDKISEEDGQGGTRVKYIEGATFLAILFQQSETINKIADAITNVQDFKILTKRNVSLDFHDVIKRKEDGQIFRILGNNTENQTPEMADINLRGTTAEKWRLPT